jgi:hypothetical protein
VPNPAPMPPERRHQLVVPIGRRRRDPAVHRAGPWAPVERRSRQAIGAVQHLVGPGRVDPHVVRQCGAGTELVGPVAANHAYHDAMPRLAADAQAVCASVQVEPHLARLFGDEATPEMRRAAGRSPSCEKDLHRPVRLVVNHSQLGAVRAVDVHHPGQPLIECGRDLREPVAPTAELGPDRSRRKPAVRERQPGERPGNGGIREAILQARRNRVPYSPLEPRQHPGIELARLPG